MVRQARGRLPKILRNICTFWGFGAKTDFPWGGNFFDKVLSGGNRSITMPNPESGAVRAFSGHGRRNGALILLNQFVTR